MLHFRSLPPLERVAKIKLAGLHPLNLYLYTLNPTNLTDCSLELYFRVATVREKYMENEIFSRSGKSQGILWMAREI